MARRGENIYKRKDGRWEGRYIKGKNSDGKSAYGYVYSKTYNEVKEKLSKAKSECKIFLISENSKITLSEFALQWLESIRKNCKPSTYVKYRNTVFKHILPVLGNYQVHQIETKVINTFCHEKLQNASLSPKTVKDILSIIKLIIKHARNFDVLCNCDFENISIKPNKCTVKGLTPIQTEKIKAFLTNNINYVNIGILISFYTGVRIGELCALKFNDISFETNTMNIDKTMQRIQNFKGDKKKTDIVISSPKSECSIREIPIPSFIIDLIIKNNLYKKDAYLLTGEASRFIEPRTLENKFNKIADICNIENVTFHMIRHTFASNCIEAGVDAKSLSEILGHSSVNITLNRYVHSSMETKKKNMEKLYTYTCFSPSAI